MNLSALEREVKALESSLDSIEWWITASTLLVIIGLVIEYWLPLSELIEALRRRPPFPWAKLTEMIGGVFVTIGVAGELWFQSNASRKQAVLRTDNRQVVALLNAQAAKANERAGAANIEAGEARREASESNVLAKKYEADIAGSNARAKHAELQVALANAASRDAVARVASAEARSAEASAKAEEFRLAIAKAEQRSAEAVLKTTELRATLIPLDLNENEQRAIGISLRRYSGRTIVLSCSNLDFEGRMLADLLASSLRSGGVVVPPYKKRGGLTWGSMGNGLILYGDDIAFVEAIRASLSDMGNLNVEIMPRDPNSKAPTDPVIFIGVYPFKKERR